MVQKNVETDLITTCAGKEVDIVHIQWLHAQGALQNKMSTHGLLRIGVDNKKKNA